ncbi:hypothetical protein MiSe_42870 [Microseira wollei NIES-4236]|uniref:Transposase n=1 Tax=Microseira wollei NIES-4236 TaxID=2530354 RepID=A0AAV3XGI9_9CYAN|nr:hypothetical protein MiSe_42870 [Microseira wollei NIES-4236]
MKFSKLDYCQYLLSGQINYTITNLADDIKKISHDQINRYLRAEKLSHRLWENVKPLIQSHDQGYIILDKRYSQ